MKVLQDCSFTSEYKTTSVVAPVCCTRIKDYFNNFLFFQGVDHLLSALDSSAALACKIFLAFILLLKYSLSYSAQYQKGSALHVPANKDIA